MRTVKQASEFSGISEKLIRAVIRQLGDKESLHDVMRGGADAGFSGFTYYSDTVEFFKKNRSEICAMADRQASDFGTNTMEMVSNFGCFRDYNKSEKADHLMPSIGRCLYGGRLSDSNESDDITVANALAWYALEEVARAMCDE